jgi:hypothetical protein
MQLRVNIRTRYVNSASNRNEYQESGSQVWNAIIPDI